MDSSRGQHLGGGVEVGAAALLCAGPERPCHAGEHLSHSLADVFNANLQALDDRLKFTAAASEGELQRVQIM